jgi:hypothetical protein
MDKPEESSRRSPAVLLIGAAALVVMVALFYWASRYAPAPVKAPDQPLAMGQAEQAYVSQIEFLEPQVARASNFLNQEVTFVFGAVRNNGPRAIRQIEITLEFHDVFRQVVLRDTQRLFGSRAIPLASYHRRDFQLTYESMPAQWNQAYPEIRITGLAVE